MLDLSPTLGEYSDLENTPQEIPGRASLPACPPSITRTLIGASRWKRCAPRVRFSFFHGVAHCNMNASSVVGLSRYPSPAMDDLTPTQIHQSYRRSFIY